MRTMRCLALAALAMIVVTVACHRAPTIQQYQKDGLQFSYYSDWAVMQDAPVPGKPSIRQINIEGPDHALVSLICEPAASRQTLDEFAAAVANLRGTAIENKLNIGSLKTTEVTRGTSEPTAGNISGQMQSGILQQFSIDILGTQVPHEAKFFMATGDRYKIMIMSQVATAHAADAHPASELIMRTLTGE